MNEELENDIWDDYLPISDDFIDLDMELDHMTVESFSESLRPIVSLLQSQFIDMRSEGLQIFLSNCCDSSYEEFFSELTVTEFYPDYVNCIKSLLNIILLNDAGLQINKKNITLALGCLAHLSKYQLTKVFYLPPFPFLPL